MASPSLSLDSLSSPSPSPSPPPPTMPPAPTATATQAHTTPTTAATGTLDTDSDLSELTDDDQEDSGVNDKRPGGAASASAASSLSKHNKQQGGEGDDEDDPVPASSHPAASSSSRPARRGASSFRRGGPRRKRSSLVPAPMWGWAESKAASAGGTAPAEEEEEEDTTDPPRAMEEEEEEEEEDDEEDDVAYRPGMTPEEFLAIPKTLQGRPLSEKKKVLLADLRRGVYRGGRVVPGKTNAFQRSRYVSMARSIIEQTSDEEHDEEDEDSEADGEDKSGKPDRQPAAAGKRVAQHKSDKNEEEDGPPNANGGDPEEDSASGSEYASTKKKRPVKARPPAPRLRKRRGKAVDDVSGSEHPAPSRKKRNGPKAQQQLPVKEEERTSDADSDGAGNSTEDEDPAPPLISPISPSRAAANANSKPLSAIASNSISALSALAAIAEAVDSTGSPTHELASASIAVASFSITDDPPPPVSATNSSAAAAGAAGSRSRSHSPDEAKSDVELSADEPKPVKGKGRRGGRGGSRGKGKYRGRVSAATAAAAAEKKDAASKVNGAASPRDTTPADLALLPKINAAKKGPPPPLDLEIKTALEDPESKPLIETGDQDMEVDGAEPEDEVNDRSMEDVDVSMDADDPEEEEEEEDEEDGEDEESVREEEAEHLDDEAPEADIDPDADEEAVEGEGEENENEAEGDADEDVEQQNDNDNDADAAEAERENEAGEEGENDEEPTGDADADVDVDDHESDLQPAHRAEALDQLATIELKFALLRERVYVEKMEGLAWEEAMVQSAMHPEMVHLQKELSRRRDKRLELASRKRSYETANAVTRRKADEAAVWSWWKFTRDELQTDMISETSRKRRKLERERRAMEKPQPIRRIPQRQYFDMHNPPPPPNLRKIAKAYPFGTRKQNKSDTHHHHHNSYYSKVLVYPEISTLSAMDINADLEYLFQNRKMPAGYDMQQPPYLAQHQPQHYSSQYPPSHQLSRNGPGVVMPGPGGMSVGRSSSMGMGITNGVMAQGVLPPSQMPPSSAMGPPHPMQQHVPGHGDFELYEMYPEPHPGYGPGGPPPPLPPSGRLRDQYLAQGPGGPVSLGPPPPPQAGGRESVNPYPNFSSGRSGHGHPHGGYPGAQEMSTMAPGPGSGGQSNTTGVGHQILPHHPYFGQGSMGGPGGAPPGQPPQSSAVASSSHMSSSHAAGSGKTINGRRSISPVHIMSNGAPSGSGSSSKPNGAWMGMVPSGGWDRDPRAMHEEEERERIVMRERERDRSDRKREEREREKAQRERERERERDRENFEAERFRQRERELHQQELERDRDRDRPREHQHMQQLSQQPQHRQPAGSSGGPLPPGSSHSGHSHLAPPPSSQGSGTVPHHHHHHRMHHHHIVHHHHSQGPQHASSSLPPSGGGGERGAGGAGAPIVHSPRDFDRPPLHPGSGAGGHSHPTEVITLSSGKNVQPPPSGPREREREAPPGHWPSKSSEDYHHPSVGGDYRDREKDLRDNRDRDREGRKTHPHSQRHSSGPPMVPFDDRGDRPMATPFVMASSQTMQQAVAGMSSNSHLNGSGLGSSTSSPRGGPSWNPPPPAADDPSYRMSSSTSSGAPPSGYIPPPQDAHTRSPVQGHRYASGAPAHVPSLGRMPSTSSSSGHHHRMPSPPIPPPGRARPTHSPAYSTSMPGAHRSPVTSPKMRALSPPPSGSGKSQIIAGPSAGAGYSSSPHLSGPGRTATPTGHHPPPLSSAASSGPPLPSLQSDVVMKNGTTGPASSFAVGSSRTVSPLMSSLHPPLSGPTSTGRPTVNGISNGMMNIADRDRVERERERHAVTASSPRVGPSSVLHPPPPSKLST